MQTQGKHTVEDVVQWVLLHRKDGDAFKDYTDDEVRRCLLKAADSKTLRLDVNNRGEIFGVFVFEPVIHINHILTSHKYSMINILSSMLMQFPGYSCTAIRKGKHKKYNVIRTLQLLEKD